MIIKKLLPLFLVVLCLSGTIRAQNITNLNGLRQSALQAEQNNKQLQARLVSLAKLRGWPLSITLRKGHQAILYGLGPKGAPLYISTNDNIISAATIGTSQLWPGGSTGLNLSGSSDTLKGKIAIWDGGRVLGTHQELVGRVLQKDGAIALNDHSTHVSGTMIASGVNPVAKGMAFGAKQLLAYDFNSDVPEMFAAAPGLLISNHSYGTVAGWNYNTDSSHWEWYGDPGDTVDYKFGYYNDQAQDWDSIAYLAPNYLIVKSVGNNRDENGPAVGQPYYRYNADFEMVAAGNRPAGISNNDGYDIVPTYGVAKNIISIGAVNPIPGGYTSPADVVLSSFTSWGPADDGRIVPTLVADGIDVLSSISTSNNAYAIYSGTSMASPAAAGSGFLLQEYYFKLHQSFMWSSTLKGILVHTADEAGAANGPDYQFGYGLIDMVKAASVIKSNNSDQLIQQNILTNTGSGLSLPVVASGKGPLVATICWTDPPGTVDETNILNNSAPKLINDLDIRVTGNGHTYLPWILNRLAPNNPATTGDDKLNNVEKIEIPNAVPGQSYVITVTHKGTLRNAVSQAYSLLVSGVGSANYCNSAPTSTAGTRIDQISIGNLNITNSASVCSGYIDNTAQIASLQASQSIPFTIRLSTCDATSAARVVKIFIDYNNNGLFTDSGETAAVSTVLAGGTTTYSGTLNIPAGMTAGNTTRMRIVTVETSDTAAVQPCNTYGRGETDDITVTFVALTNDVGMSAVVDPLPGACQVDSERVSVRIRNSGTASQMNFPIRLKVISGTSTLADVTTIYPDTVVALGSSIYTFQPVFHMAAGATYIIQVTTLLPGDQNPANDALSDTVVVSSGSTPASGEAEICSASPVLVGLKANTADNTDAASWFDSPTAATPIATGVQTTTTVLPDNKTYYLGLNEVTGSVGPKNKLAFPNGGYNYFQGNFVKFHNDVPLTITTTRLYVGAAGKVEFIVADLADYDSCTGAFSYYPISTNTIDVYPTTPNPSRTASSVNSPLDTGAVFLLNLSVPTAGDHVIIVLADDSAFLFRNNGITTNPYPMGIPGVFTITGNSAISTTNCKDTAFYQGYYYFFYDMHISLNKCASPRVAVEATTPVPVTITLVGKVLHSNYASGNQWYYHDSLIAGPGGTQDTLGLIGPGVYKDVVSDSTGCPLSGTFNNQSGSNIGFLVTPNPNPGAFRVQFYTGTAANADLRIVDLNGKELYKLQTPNFSGSFDKYISLRALEPGVYVVQLVLGGNKYVQKMMVY